jgi:serine/threonine protein kinase
VLKSYSSEFEDAKIYYYNEIEAFKILMSEEKFEQNIVTFYGSWRQGTTYNILLEYADRGTLIDYFENTAPPTEYEDIISFWSALLDVTKGLKRIHELEYSEVGQKVIQG